MAVWSYRCSVSRYYLALRYLSTYPVRLQLCVPGQYNVIVYSSGLGLFVARVPPTHIEAQRPAPRTRAAGLTKRVTYFLDHAQRDAHTHTLAEEAVREEDILAIEIVARAAMKLGAVAILGLRAARLVRCAH